MTENQIKVLKIDPDKAPYVKEIENTLQGLQSEVGGLIEVLSLDDGNILLCNEEGKLNGMAPNRWLGSGIINGPFFICGDDQNGDFASLSEDAIKKYQAQFSEIPKFSGNESELEPRIEVIGFQF